MSPGTTPATKDFVDFDPYGPYSSIVRKVQKRGAEEARNQLPTLLTNARSGVTTIITRRGQGVAAIVPLENLPAGAQRSLLPLAGTAAGLWGPDSAETLRALRDEWKR